ncbi:hypothetical protein AQUCO_00900004v1 [Aquilegia coerulea]|uniref:PQ-loop repeat family protein / transmembrane family protein n=1 Tax=Aquilegia coerulea TaxID=218851 RepID=A0A2G5EBD0_AQUCA|nr:hypothetical protein AQUCO_00900004v1 [Aquilegia coerulea]PIA53078.1 hypothetical protein AQUCO_00900004v1 [Aquilegia coerulea]PIA53079.1 hypothetical protein AQUCO_00900004v1 [Aquilegia coerulea]
MILMGLLNGSPPVCPTDLPCSQWAQTYIKYCLCTTRDSVSLALGFLSVLSWGVAEVPQIITNYRHKSAEGLSIAFLMTWIVGDLFNLFGCMLEPATLPTQYYMAVLYTITTLILSSQSIYYGHIYHRIKDKSQDLLKTGLKLPQSITEYKEDHISNEEHVKFGDSWTRGSSILQGALPSSPIPVTAPVLPRYGSLGRELYYMSARSLSKSHTPTAGSCLAQTIGHGGTLPFSIGGSHSVEEPLLGTLVFTQSEPPSKTKSMLCVISAVAFLFGSFNFHLSTSSRLKRVRENLPQGVVIRIGRKLLQSSTMLVLRHEGEVSSGIGTFLGWAMAIIYMGGRLPQIYLNIRRGNVEGLSPLMFIFALVGNMTYVASILVSSLQWSKISANLPWLVDAGGCVLLDTCILIQFVYFRYWRSLDPKSKPAL